MGDDDTNCGARFCYNDHPNVYESCHKNYIIALENLVKVLKDRDELFLSAINVAYIDDEFIITAFC